MKLLIEWGQTGMVREMLDELGGRRAWCWRTAVTKSEADAMAAIVLQRSFLNKARAHTRTHAHTRIHTHTHTHAHTQHIKYDAAFFQRMYALA